jgi:hypothetical protein
VRLVIAMLASTEHMEDRGDQGDPEKDPGHADRHQVADLLNLEVGLLFFDTASTYFELPDEDDPVARNWRGRSPAAMTRLMLTRPPGSARTVSRRTAATTLPRS